MPTIGLDSREQHHLVDGHGAHSVGPGTTRSSHGAVGRSSGPRGAVGHRTSPHGHRAVIGLVATSVGRTPAQHQPALARPRLLRPSSGAPGPGQRARCRARPRCRGRSRRPQPPGTQPDRPGGGARLSLALRRAGVLGRRRRGAARRWVAKLPSATLRPEMVARARQCPERSRRTVPVPHLPTTVTPIGGRTGASGRNSITALPTT